MDVINLRNFCTDKYPTLIELYKNGERWLFATDATRAVGVRTNEFVSNSLLEDSTSGITRCIKDLFETNREFKSLRRQRFMVFLHLEKEDEKHECDECRGSGRVTCHECNGDGNIECSECEGSGTIYDDCEECEGSGKKHSDCDECGGTGKDKSDCDDCDGSGKQEYDCDECGGSGFEDDEETKKCSECTSGKVEGDCDYCTDGVVESDCPSCEEGQVEDDCDECEDGKVEKDCDDCIGGNVECHECDSDNTVECNDCDDDEEKKDVGIIYNTAFDLALLKDLSMDYFDEISPSTVDQKPLVLRGKGVQAFIMPMNVNLSTIHDRTYCP